MLKDKQAALGLHRRSVPCRRAAVYNLTHPATKATPWLILALDRISGGETIAADALVALGLVDPFTDGLLRGLELVDEFTLGIRRERPAGSYPRH